MAHSPSALQLCGGEGGRTIGRRDMVVVRALWLPEGRELGALLVAARLTVARSLSEPHLRLHVAVAARC